MRTRTLVFLLALAAAGLTACAEDPSGPDTGASLDLTTARYVYVEYDGGAPYLKAVNRGADAPIELSLENAVKLVDRLDSPDLNPDNILYLSDPRWSPDGNRVGVVAGDADRGDHHMVVVDVADTIQEPRILGPGGSPIRTWAWSPSGNRVAFIVEDSNQQLYVQDLTTDEFTLVAMNFAGRGPVIRWSADGSAVLVAHIEYTVSGQPDTPYTAIDRITVPGGEVTRLAGDVEGIPQAVSSDGNTVLVLRPAGGDALSGLTYRVRHVFLPGDRTTTVGSVGSWAWARFHGSDGEVLTALHPDPGRPGGLELIYHDLRVIPVESEQLSGQDRVLANGDFWEP